MKTRRYECAGLDVCTALAAVNMLCPMFVPHAGSSSNTTRCICGNVILAGYAVLLEQRGSAVHIMPCMQATTSA
jgi:hypothetical protein